MSSDGIPKESACPQFPVEVRNIRSNINLSKNMGIKVQGLVMKFSSMAWEMGFGIKSRGCTYGAATDEIHYYSTIPYQSVMGILRNAPVRPDDVFFDIGCGKGRILCCAQLFSPKKVVGIEIDKGLSDTARSNLERMRGRKSPFAIINASATACDYNSGTVFYLFNPFGHSTLEQTLSLIENTLESNPRKIRIIYVNPVFDRVLEASGWLGRYDAWERGRKFGLFHDVSFWESRQDKIPA